MIKRFLLIILVSFTLLTASATPAFAAVQNNVKRYEIISCGYNQVAYNQVSGTDGGRRYTLRISLQQDFNSYDGSWCSHVRTTGSISTDASYPSGRTLYVYGGSYSNYCHAIIDYKLSFLSQCTTNPISTGFSASFAEAYIYGGSPTHPYVSAFN